MWNRNLGKLLFLVIFVTKSALASAAPDTQHKLRFAYPSAGTLISLQVGNVLQKTDILKKHGIEAEITPMALGKELKTAMASEKVDIIFTSESNFVVLVGQGFDCRAFASLGSGGDMALVVNAASPVKKISDLKGKKIGTVFGTSLHQPAVEWAKQAGLTPGKDVTIVNMNSVGAMQTALEQNELDAIISLDPFLTDAQNNKRVRVLAKTNIDLIVLVSAKYLQEHPQAVKAFQSAMREAAFYFATHKEEVNKWAADMNKTAPDILDQASRKNKNYSAKSAKAVDLKISSGFKQKLQRLADFLYEEKLIQNKVETKNYLLAL